MANLVSGGVSVTITDESFYIPAAAPTVPLIFIATAAEKNQAGSTSIAPLPAAGTYESGVVRVVTSVRQSGELYGAPRFMHEKDGRLMHGDARNEYGLASLNAFLGVGSTAFVVRADVNLDDDIISVRKMWDAKFDDASTTLEGLATEYIAQYNKAQNLVSSSPGFKRTVTKTELLGLINKATAFIWSASTFKNSMEGFVDDHTTTPLKVYSAGYDVASTGTYVGIEGMATAWVTDGTGTLVPAEWTPSEASNFILEAADLYKFTVPYRQETSLGANDAARRVAITTALQKAILSNEDIRSEKYRYNLIVCPGFQEVDDALLTLCTDINEEALVLGNTPMFSSPEEILTWSTTAERQKSHNIAYWYPSCAVIPETFSGEDVVMPIVAGMLRVIAYNDKVANVWWAPAGSQRGGMTGVSDVGYLLGTAGNVTQFVSVALNQGQRDMLYQNFTNINPVVFFPTRGLLAWGNKTSATATSALDRINVIRLLMYMKRELRESAMPFVFMPNDTLTRINLKAMADSFLSNLLTLRALYDFVTICDDSNNTPDRIDRNELYLDIVIKPTKTAEFIYIPIRVVNTGA